MYDQVVDWVQIVQLQIILRIAWMLWFQPYWDWIFEMSYVADNLECFSSSKAQSALSYTEPREGFAYLTYDTLES